MRCYYDTRLLTQTIPHNRQGEATSDLEMVTKISKFVYFLMATCRINLTYLVNLHLEYRN